MYKQTNKQITNKYIHIFLCAACIFLTLLLTFLLCCCLHFSYTAAHTSLTLLLALLLCCCLHSVSSKLSLLCFFFCCCCALQQTIFSQIMQFLYTAVQTHITYTHTVMINVTNMLNMQ